MKRFRNRTGLTDSAALMSQMAIVNQADMYYGEVREPLDKAGAVGAWSCSRLASHWLGSQNVPSRPSAAADS